MDNWLDDQIDKAQELSAYQVGEFFHNLTSTSKPRADSQRELESIIGFYSSSIYKYISVFIEDVSKLKIKQSAIEKERDNLFETVSKLNDEISLLKAKLSVVQNIKGDEGHHKHESVEVEEGSTIISEHHQENLDSSINVIGNALSY